MKQGIVYDWKFLASVLANEGDDVQSEFFKAMVKEMDSWGTTFQKQSQFAGVNLKLNDHEKDILGMIGYREGVA